MRTRIAAAGTIVLIVALLGAASLRAAPPSETASAGAGSITVQWTVLPGMTSSDIYWNTSNALVSGWGWPDHGTPLFCEPGSGRQNTCTGYRDLAGSATSFTISGLAAGTTYYVQVSLWNPNEPNATSTGEPLYYTNVVTATPKAASTGGGNSGGNSGGSSQQQGTVTHEDGTTANFTGAQALQQGDTLESGAQPLTVPEAGGKTVLDAQTKILVSKNPRNWTVQSGTVYFSSTSGTCRPLTGGSTGATAAGRAPCAYSLGAGSGGTVIRCYKGGCSVLAARFQLLKPGQQATVDTSLAVRVIHFTSPPHPFWGK